MIRVVVAEDQRMLLSALSRLLDLEEDIDVVGRATDGREALMIVRRLDPDILVTDIEMPDLSGLDVALQIQQDGLRTRTLVVTTFGRAGYLRRAMDAGVRGYLLKDAPSEDLVDAIRTIAAGGQAVAPDLMKSAWAEKDPLSERDRRVLRLAEAGLSAKDIASELGLSPGTTRNYLHEASQKVGGRNRVEAARIAREKGWL